MRPDEQRAALDRFVSVEAKLERYKKVRDEWLVTRRDLVDRTNRARELAQEADRLKFALTEIDGVDPAPGEDEALVAEIRACPNSTRCARPPTVPAPHCRRRWTRCPKAGRSRPSTPSARAIALLESTDDAVLAALAASSPMF